MRKIFLLSGLGLLVVFLLGILFLSYRGKEETFSEGTSKYYRDIYLDRKKVGYSTFEIIEKEGDIRQVEERSVISLSVLGKRSKLEKSCTYIFREGKLESFVYEIKGGKEISNRIVGNLEGDTLRIAFDSGNQSKMLNASYLEDFVIPSLLPFKIASYGFKKGKELRFILFDPIMLYSGVDAKKLEATIRVLDKETVSTPNGNYDAYKVAIHLMDTSSYMWITEKGKMIKELSPLGFISYLNEKKPFYAYGLRVASMDQKLSIASNVVIPAPRSVRKLKVRIQGVDLSRGWDIHDGYRQFVKEDIVEIDTTKEGNASGKEVDYELYTKGTNLIDPFDPAIQRLSSSLVSSDMDDRKKVQKIVKWVYENIDKTPVFGVPYSSRVLRDRKGDCNEHAVLLAALLRSLGIPSKIAIGVVYLRGRFYYHAWNEVYDNGWFAVDSSFGQYRVDATHIKFFEGDISKSSEIMKALGKIKLEVIFYE